MMEISKVAVRNFANTYLIQDEEGAILVDAGLPGGEKAILQTCREQNAMPGLIIITHGHFDHMGSAAALKEQTGAKVAIHTEDAEALRTGVSKMDKPVGVISRIMPLFMGRSRTRPVEPDILISEEIGLEEYGISGKILLTPGHTSGSISVMLNSGEVFVSDLIMGGFFGKIRSRHPNLPPFEIGRSDIKNSVRYVLDQNPTIIYPGHGGPFTPEAVAKWHKSL
ncbi:MAG: MBL fold metallo-hydrolase [Dehalococcoidia bacterium]